MKCARNDFGTSEATCFSVHSLDEPHHHSTTYLAKGRLLSGGNYSTRDATRCASGPRLSSSTKPPRHLPSPQPSPSFSPQPSIFCPRLPSDLRQLHYCLSCPLLPPLLLSLATRFAHNIRVGPCAVLEQESLWCIGPHF
jgi:hypothetical protein